MRRIVFSMGLLGLLSAARTFAEEPICGKWLMIYQKVGDMKDMPKPVPGIKITQNGTALRFEYTTGIEEKTYLTFNPHMDGSPADMLNERGDKVGTARLTKSGAVYTLIFEKRNGTQEPGKISLSQDGKLLTMESEASVPDHGPGPTHIIQQFARPGKVPF
jgi:hypothetical protein